MYTPKDNEVVMQHDMGGDWCERWVKLEADTDQLDIADRTGQAAAKKHDPLGVMKVLKVAQDPLTSDEDLVDAINELKPESRKGMINGQRASSRAKAMTKLWWLDVEDAFCPEWECPLGVRQYGEHGVSKLALVVYNDRSNMDDALEAMELKQEKPFDNQEGAK